MAQTLLEKALHIPSNGKPNKISDEEVGLAVAWANGRISQKQVSHALGLKTGTSVYTPLALALRQYIVNLKK